MTEARTDIVAVSNRGTLKLHRAGCVYAQGATRPVYESEPSHRIYTICGTCLKGKSIFALWSVR